MIHPSQKQNTPAKNKFEPGAVVGQNDALNHASQSSSSEPDPKRTIIAEAEATKEALVRQMDKRQSERKDVVTSLQDLENRIGSAHRNGDMSAIAGLQAELAPLKSQVQEIDAALVKLQTSYREQDAKINMQASIIAEQERQAAFANMKTLAQQWADVVRDNADLLDAIEDAYKFTRTSLPVGGLFPDRSQPRVGAINVTV